MTVGTHPVDVFVNDASGGLLLDVAENPWGIFVMISFYGKQKEGFVTAVGEARRHDPMPPPSALGLARKSGTGSPSEGSTGRIRERGRDGGGAAAEEAEEGVAGPAIVAGPTEGEQGGRRAEPEGRGEPPRDGGG